MHDDLHEIWQNILLLAIYSLTKRIDFFVCLLLTKVEQRPNMTNTRAREKTTTNHFYGIPLPLPHAEYRIPNMPLLNTSSKSYDKNTITNILSHFNLDIYSVH